jgi:hypothetical protein
MLGSGPKRCDDFGYPPRVALSALELLRQHGDVCCKNVMLENTYGKSFFKVFYLPGTEPPKDLPTLEQAFEVCTAAVEALMNPCV